MREGGEKVSESGEKGLFLADLFNVEQLSAKDTFENVKRKEKLENTFSTFFSAKKKYRTPTREGADRSASGLASQSQ